MARSGARPSEARKIIPAIPWSNGVHHFERRGLIGDRPKLGRNLERFQACRRLASGRIHRRCSVAHLGAPPRCIRRQIHAGGINSWQSRPPSSAKSHWRREIIILSAGLDRRFGDLVATRFGRERHDDRDDHSASRTAPYRRNRSATGVFGALAAQLAAILCSLNFDPWLLSSFAQ